MRDIYIDSEVIVDFLLDNKPFSDSAAALFSLAESNQITIHISACSFGKLYNQLVTDDNVKHLYEILRKLSYLVRIVEVNSRVIQLSLSSGIAKFDHALEFYTALQVNQVSVFLTRTFDVPQKQGLLIMTPENYLNCIQRVVCS
jgi:predicted nucleic acid-binding protein